MIQPGSNDAQDEAEEQGVPHVIGVLAAPPGLHAGHVSGNQDGHYDDNAVPVYNQRA
jgi:hypothetical protein